uniref:Uncharacterized protein n=1 Tax=Tanacetum cinerariifolium TaxID=118510 RepID=A0A6L2P0P0_TANCI|nr:hypothetical protein [Tanacetum cinerariifolium]
MFLLAVVSFPLLVLLLLSFPLAVKLLPLLVQLLQEERAKKFWWSLNTPKKKKLQEHIDAQVARELEEQQEKEDMRMNEQIARDAEVARIQAEEELQGMIDSLDKSNETIAKYLQEYQDFASELPLEKMIELISDLVKYQDNYSKVYKFQSQQRRPMNKKQKREYYMAMIRNNLGWKVKDFKEWKLYDLSRVHHLTAKDKEIFMLVEKDYPLRKGLALVMISYKLQVENYSQMAEDLIRKIYNIANTLR